MQEVTQVRCAYCGHDCPLPQKIVQARAAEALARVDLLLMQGAKQAAKEQDQILPWRMALAGLMLVGSFGLASSSSLSARGLVPTITSAATLVVGGFVVHRWMGKRREQRWATLSLAAPGRTENTACCPSCGATLPQQQSDPVVQCGHCRVQSLLPSEVLDERARQRRHRIAVTRDEAIRTGSRVNTGWLVFSVVLLLAMFSATLASWLLSG